MRSSLAILSRMEGWVLKREAVPFPEREFRDCRVLRVLLSIE